MDETERILKKALRNADSSVRLGYLTVFFNAFLLVVILVMDTFLMSLNHTFMVASVLLGANLVILQILYAIKYILNVLSDLLDAEA